LIHLLTQMVLTPLPELSGSALENRTIAGLTAVYYSSLMEGKRAYPGVSFYTLRFDSCFNVEDAD
jgi:hypothetical protein